ncbi:MAG: YchF family ATPase [Calditrichaeota bacterium]|nr:YchF family ATPase [Calditrichota bacterium]MCB9368540.1 redox-regulated ATPase YchF [Calditrichota bacterium]
MNIGLIGAPQSGKTTVFHLLTGTEPDPAAMHKRETLRAVTQVPDPRVDKLGEMSESRKLIHTTVEYLDTPGLEEGASKQSWFEGVFSGELKNADALALVVRGFELAGALESAEPPRDIRRIQDELIFSDLIVIEKRHEKLLKQVRVKPPTAQETLELNVLERAKAQLEDGKPLRILDLEVHEKKALRGFQLLSEKPVLVVLNLAEDTLSNAVSLAEKLSAEFAADGMAVIGLSAAIEAEIAGLEAAERELFMTDLGVTQSARDRVLQASYALLGMQSFLTTGDKETRAWPIHAGETAVDAAGVIHSDLAKGFIRAEVVHYDDFVREGGYPGCKAKGLVRLEGKDYVVKDGDILVIRHSG